MMNRDAPILSWKSDEFRRFIIENTYKIIAVFVCFIGIVGMLDENKDIIAFMKNIMPLILLTGAFGILFDIFCRKCVDEITISSEMEEITLTLHRSHKNIKLHFKDIDKVGVSFYPYMICNKKLFVFIDFDKKLLEILSKNKSIQWGALSFLHSALKSRHHSTIQNVSQEKITNEKVYSYKLAPWVGILFMFISFLSFCFLVYMAMTNTKGVIASNGVERLSPEALTMFFWTGAVSAVVIFLLGFCLVIPSFLSNQYVILSDTALVFPEGLIRKKTVRLPLTSIKDIQVVKKYDYRSLAIYYNGTKFSFMEGMFKNESDFEEFCNALTIRSKFINSDSAHQERTVC
ncbi:hypothetical protein LJC47_05555 [Desulfosarcina sp. OttesenSCG-928-B08]|nr:hypothetical protein [Desulfosarcina sp. OttesenSCG-928-B08]